MKERVKINGLLRLSEVKEPKNADLVRISSGILGIDRIIGGFTFL